MTLVISKVFTYDDDAATYIQAVEAADAQALEPATRKAINNFVIGCKQDGIWSAIKASCILAGARTLAGALVPLVGAAPTNNNFVSGDYNRETGLVGDGSTKYLDSNRNNNTDPQNSQHLAIHLTSTIVGRPIGIALASNGGSLISTTTIRSRNSATDLIALSAGFYGVNRNTSTQFTARGSGINTTFVRSSATPDDGNIYVFRANASSALHTTSRMTFYSIGESLDLALLDARVTALINAFAAAIP